MVVSTAASAAPPGTPPPTPPGAGAGLDKEDRALLEAKLDLLAEAFLEGQGRRADAPRDLSGLVVAGSASYHQPGCRLVDGREQTDYLTPVEAAGRGLKACRVCQPDKAVTQVTVG